MESVCWLLLGSIALTVLSVQAQVNQCGKPPGNPNTVLTEVDIGKDTFNNGDKATFKCTFGYMIKGGSASVTCNAGTWTTLTLQCEKKSCGTPGEVMNGHFDISGGIDFGDTVQAICNTGYFLVGKGEKTCMDSGWAGNDPLCEVVKCQPPGAVANAGTADPNKELYEFGDAVSFTCLPGFVRDGPSSITCSENKLFTPAPPKCITVLCETPVIQNAKRIGGARPPYGYQSFVTYGCEDGYTLEGASELTCGIDSKWSHPFPVCKETPSPTTKTPSTTPKPTPSSTVPVSVRVPGPVGPTDKPSRDDFNGWYIGGPLLALAAVLGVICCFAYHKKKSSRGDYRGKPTADDGAL